MSADILMNQQPSAIEAEEGILSILIDYPSLISEAAHLVRADEFYLTKNEEIFRSLIEMNEAKKEVNLITLGDYLGKNLELVGGMDYLSHLVEIRPLSSFLESYCKLVKSKATLRKIILISDVLKKDAYESNTPDEIIEKGADEFYQLIQKSHHEEMKSISEIMEETLKRIEDLCASKGKITGITTGFADLDKMLNGLQRSDLVLLAARPSMGKTALGINFATNAAKAGYSVAVFSLEMSGTQLGQRILAAETGLSLGKLLTGDLDITRDFNIIGTTMDHLIQRNLHIDETPGISVQELRSKCKRLKSRPEGLDMVLIDYLQLMTVNTGRNENRQQEISTISRSLKGLAKELDCPVVALSQLSRGPEQRTDHRPMMSDLRESGAIEQDADVVLLLYRPGYYDKDVPESETIVNIAKHRNGQTGDVQLFYHGELTRFNNYASTENS